MWLSEDFKRIAFCGASGTGKSVLADYIQKRYNLEYNPVGSRSVAKDMGFDNPYDVDAAGRRLEFQGRLLRAKIEWEEQHETFVSDRTTLDNLAYTILHSPGTVSDTYWEESFKALSRYDVIFYTPLSSFHSCAGDPARKSDPTYHKGYDALLVGLLKQSKTLVLTVSAPDLPGRFTYLTGILDREC